VVVACSLTLLMAASGFATVAPWVVKRGITQAATDRGWSAEPVNGRIGLRGITFRSLRLRAARDASIDATLAGARIGWSALLGARYLSVESGVVQLIGDATALRELMRAPRSSNAEVRSSPKPPTFDLNHLDVTWRERESAPPSVVVHDLNVDRNAEHLQVRAASVAVHRNGFALEVKDLVSVRQDQQQAAVNPSKAPALATQAKASEVAVQYDTSASVPARANTPAPAASLSSNLAPPSSSGTVPPAASAPAAARKSRNGVAATHQQKSLDPIGHASEKAAKKEFLPSLRWLMDEVELLRSSFDQERSNANRGETWLDGVATGSKFDCPAVRLRITDEGQKLDLGPWPIAAERNDQQLVVELTQRASEGRSALSSKFVIEDKLDRASLRLSVGPISLPQLGITEGDFGLENIQATQLGLELGAQFALETGELSFESKGRVSGLSIRQPFISRDTIKGMGFEWEGAAKLDSVKRRIHSEQLRVSVGPVATRLKGDVELANDHHTIDGSLEIPLAACQDLFDVLPEGMTPLLRGWRVDRNFALRLTVAFDSRKPTKSSIGFRLDNQCRVLSVPAEVSPSKFERPFVLEVEDERGVVQPTSFGPGTWGYTPLAAISPYVESAVLVCEDGRFLNHDGFDREAIQNSIRENLRTGRFARGGSTVSMQLAKNLYLRRDKTLARKLQEAALTMLLEQTFSKRELLELYLNVIEFGPGVYGIGPAAKHYFDTTPDRLTMAQSFFLISILPNPKASHFGTDGSVHPGWLKLVHSLMAIAQRRGHFTTAELEAGIAEPPALHVPGTPPPATARRILHDPGAFLDEELELPSHEDE
jgi:hypothetical protein